MQNSSVSKECHENVFSYSGEIDSDRLAIEEGNYLARVISAIEAFSCLTEAFFKQSNIVH